VLAAVNVDGVTASDADDWVGTIGANVLDDVC
jgi:hypothetical protein